MLVEDNKINQMLVKKMIENLGCKVIVANSGLESLQMLDGNTPDLILTDIQMPMMNGMELARKIKSHTNPITAAIPILALTGYAGEDEKNAALSSGILNVMIKPFGQDELKTVISQALKINPDRP